MSLSKEHVITTSFPVKYIHFPKNKVLTNELPETIDIEIRSSGFNLLLYKFKRNRDTIIVDVKDSKPSHVKNHYYLSIGSRIEKVRKQFKNEIKIQKIDPDTLFLNFNKKVTKTVPVKHNLAITFDNNYQLKDSIKLKPKTIQVSGAPDIINKIDHVETVPMQIDNISNSDKRKLNILITPNFKSVEISPKSVEAIIEVAKYTEASLEIPIEVEHLPKGYTLKIFPDKITVKYNVAFNDYENINALQFRAVVDYKKIEKGNNKLKISLTKYPPKVRAVKLSTEKVEYIIKK